MKKEEFLIKLKDAVEVTTKKQIEISRRARDETKEEAYFHEHNFRTILYNELLSQGGLYYGDILVEAPLSVTNSKISGKRFDIIITNDDEQTQYAIEIKLVRTSEGLKEWIARTDNSSRDHTVYKDLEKLQQAMKENSEEFYRREGIMIIAYNGTKSSNSEEEKRILTSIEKGLSMISRKFENSGITAIYSAGKASIMKTIEDF